MELDDEVVAEEVERPNPAPPTLRLAWTILAAKGVVCQLNFSYDQNENVQVDMILLVIAKFSIVFHASVRFAS